MSSRCPAGSSIPDCRGACGFPHPPLFPSIQSTDVLVAETRRKTIIDVANWLEQHAIGTRQDFVVKFNETCGTLQRAATALLEGRGP